MSGIFTSEIGPGQATQVQLNVGKNNQVMIVPVTLHCLDQAEELVPISHTMLRITGEKFNIDLDALYIATCMIISFYIGWKFKSVHITPVKTLSSDELKFYQVSWTHIKVNS